MSRRNKLPLVADLAGQLWLVSDPDRMQAILQEMHARAKEGLEGLRASVHEAGGVQDDETPGYELTADGTAVLRLEGPMVPETDWLTALFGFASTNGIRRALDAAAADARVKSAVIVVDSPGGSVAGVRELHQAVAAFPRPLTAHVDGAMASAALWACCAADTITASETSLVGSIGTLWKIADISKALAAEGVKVEVVRSSPLKGAPVRGEPLSAGARASLQSYVDDVAALFYADVRAARGLDDAAWEALGDPGQILSAGRALSAGLIDATSTLDAALAAAAAGAPEGRPNHDNAPEAHEESSMSTKELEERLSKLEAQLSNTTSALEAAQTATATLKAENAALKATAKAQAEEALKQRKDALLAQATTEGKVVPANRKALEDLAASAPEEVLAAFLTSAPVIVKPGTTALTETKEPEAASTTLSPEEQRDLEVIHERMFGKAAEASTESFSLLDLAKKASPAQA